MGQRTELPAGERTCEWIVDRASYKNARKHAGNALGIAQGTQGVKDDHIMVITVKIGGNKPLQGNEENA